MRAMAYRRRRVRQDCNRARLEERAVNVRVGQRFGDIIYASKIMAAAKTSWDGDHNSPCRHSRLASGLRVFKHEHGPGCDGQSARCFMINLRVRLAMHDVGACEDKRKPISEPHASKHVHCKLGATACGHPTRDA